MSQNQIKSKFLFVVSSAYTIAKTELIKELNKEDELDDFNEYEVLERLTEQFNEVIKKELENERDRSFKIMA